MLYYVPFDEKYHKYYRRVENILNEDVNVIEIGYNQMPPDHKQVMTRNLYILHYVVKGNGRFMGEAFSAGQCFLTIPQHLEIMESDVHEPYECYWVMLRGSKIPDILNKCGIENRNHVFDFSKCEVAGKLLQAYLFMDEPTNENAELYRMKAGFYELLALHMENIPQIIKKSSYKMERIADFLRGNYNQDIKINDLCNLFFLSANHLCTMFKREYGVTPQEYLISYRIEKAKQLLLQRDTTLTIAEIAFSVGIKNPLYFSRCFHKRVGLSPSEFRTKNADYSNCHTSFFVQNSVK